jgi:thiamine-monophosphate kinase
VNKPAQNRRELAVVEMLHQMIGESPEGDLWLGDDAAVISGTASSILFASDASVEGVHFDRRFVPLADVGWRSLVQNLSDVAAMGGVPTAAVVSVVGSTKEELREIYGGILEAADTYSCRIVGGDLSDGSALVVAIAIIGNVTATGAVLRSGALPGDAVFVSGALGRAAAGLELLRRDPGANGELVRAFLRPRARIAEGTAAARAGATAMIDVSDGLGIDLHRLADASSVGFVLEEVPIAEGASLADALGGGEDYEIVFTAPVVGRVESEFVRSDLAVPYRIGSIVEDPTLRTLDGAPFAPSGFAHRL